MTAPYRITRLHPGAWSIINTMTDTAVLTERTWDECMDIWLATNGVSFDELYSRWRQRLAKLDETLAALGSDDASEAPILDVKEREVA